MKDLDLYVYKDPTDPIAQTRRPFKAFKDNLVNYNFAKKLIITDESHH